MYYSYRHNESTGLYEIIEIVPELESVKIIRSCYTEDEACLLCKEYLITVSKVFERESEVV